MRFIRLLALLALSLASIAAIGETPLEVNTVSNVPNIKLATIQTPEPIEFRMEYSLHKAAVVLQAWGPLLINKGRNSSMTAQLSSALLGRNLNLNEVLRTEVERSVANAGFQIEQAPKVIGIDPSKPWGVDYKSINFDGNALLHVYIERIGVQSRSESTVYLPYAHIAYCLILPNKSKGCTFFKRSYYGEGITSEGILAYPADLTEQWIDNDAVLANIPQVESSLKKAIIKVAGGISESVIRNLEEVSAKAEMDSANAAH